MRFLRFPSLKRKWEKLKECFERLQRFFPKTKASILENEKDQRK